MSGRDMRRWQRRDIRRRLRADGCICDPTIVHVEPDAIEALVAAVTGRTIQASHDVTHAHYCPVGQAHRARVDAGLFEVDIAEGRRECER